jgi:hypothetical protein
MPKKSNYKDYLKLNKIDGVVLFILFFCSRFFFINANDVFFDTREYLDLFASPNFLKALISSHFPMHEAYIFLFWPFYNFTNLIGGTPNIGIATFQIILAAITIYCYFKFIEFIANKKTALLSSAIISLTPIFWITNVTVTIEVSYLCSFFASLYFLSVYTKKNHIIHLFVSLFFLSFAFLIYSAILLWTPLYILVVYFKKRELFFKIFLLLYVSLASVVCARILIFSSIFHQPATLMLLYLYTGNMVQVGQVASSLSGILIRIRNFIPLLVNYTSLVFILSLIGLLNSYFKNKKIFLIGLVWILPALYINQWWDSVLMGRYSLLAGFGFTFLAGYILTKHRLLSAIVVLYLLYVSIPALLLLKMPIPYIKEAAFAKSLPADGLLIDSHFALPQLEHCCKIKILGVNRPEVGNSVIEREINSYLEKKKPVFVSSAALSEPYGLYTGPYLHPLSLSYAHKFELNPLLTNYEIKIYKIIDKNDNLIMYQITSHGKSTYPVVMNMRNHYRRLDNYDPISRTVRYLGEQVPNILSTK